MVIVLVLLALHPHRRPAHRQKRLDALVRLSEELGETL
jgi:hypothetical protein